MPRTALAELARLDEIFQATGLAAQSETGGAAIERHRDHAALPFESCGPEPMIDPGPLCLRLLAPAERQRHARQAVGEQAFGQKRPEAGYLIHFPVQAIGQRTDCAAGAIDETVGACGPQHTTWQAVAEDGRARDPLGQLQEIDHAPEPGHADSREHDGLPDEHVPGAVTGIDLTAFRTARADRSEEILDGAAIVLTERDEAGGMAADFAVHAGNEIAPRIEELLQFPPPAFSAGHHHFTE
ncbi:hypothetical protein CVT23_04525 [Minwuia thermotolerans]|uniref:Uncharacterized protein n=1 Tax=Minwuia thermotolerans TaxID=2056226 RepID=A0A2M9G5A5_9PROT|nr:hypothetical protein CVT23_04525 [Minwuia thermotolerans]